MTSKELINSLIKRKIPRATVSLEPADDGYRLKVVSDHFRGAQLTDRQSMVYQALDRAPLPLLAKIMAIDCHDGC